MEKEKRIRRLAKAKPPVRGMPATPSAVAGNAVNVVRNALNLHPKPNYEAQLKPKQVEMYKHSKHMEMLKQRNMKFTCVNGFRKESSAACDPSSSNSAVCSVPVDLLQPSELEAIRSYEERDHEVARLGETNTVRAGCSSSFTENDSINNFCQIPRFDPRIPPPTLSQHPTILQQSTDEQTMQSPPPQPQQISSPNVQASSTPVLEKQIKREMDIEISDEIPSFHNSALVTTSSPTVPPPQPSNSELGYAGNEEEKRKLQLLWSICQEELTVDSELDKKAKRIVEMRKNIETLTKALKAEENAEEKLKQRKRNIGERKRKLLTSTEPTAPDNGQKRVKREGQ